MLGHFIILVNSKLLLADKKVFEQDSYPFFIDDELCVIDIAIIDGKYKYSFRFDTTAKTELNQIRSKKQRKNLLLSLSTFGTLFAVVATIIIVIFVVQDIRKWESVRDYGVVSVADVEILEFKDRHHIFYHYRDSLYHVSGTLDSYKEPNPVLDNGFPIQDDDAFLVTYSKKIKTNNKLHLNHPTNRTVDRYRKLAQATYLENHTDLSTDYCNCVLDIAYQMKKWEGYALVYNQQKSKKANKRFNQQTYQQWVTSDAFLDKEVDCWQLK